LPASGGFAYGASGARATRSILLHGVLEGAKSYARNFVVGVAEVT
jgi:hypothetical protein